MLTALFALRSSILFISLSPLLLRMRFGLKINNLFLFLIGPGQAVITAFMRSLQELSLDRGIMILVGTTSSLEVLQSLTKPRSLNPKLKTVR